LFGKHYNSYNEQLAFFKKHKDMRDKCNDIVLMLQQNKHLLKPFYGRRCKFDRYDTFAFTTSINKRVTVTRDGISWPPTQTNTYHDVGFKLGQIAIGDMPTLFELPCLETYDDTPNKQRDYFQTHFRHNLLRAEVEETDVRINFYFFIENADNPIPTSSIHCFCPTCSPAIIHERDDDDDSLSSMESDDDDDDDEETTE
jgi:hypothetical protein